MTAIQMGLSDSLSVCGLVVGFLPSDGQPISDRTTDLIYQGVSGFIDSGFWQPKAGTQVTASVWFDDQIKPTIAVGLGPTSDIQVQNLRDWSASVARSIQLEGQVAWILPTVPHLKSQEIANAIAEGILLGSYQFKRFKSEAPSKRLNHVLIAADSVETEVLNQAICRADATNMARDLANMPPNILTPWYVVELARDAVSNHPNVVIDVIDVQRATELGMGAFLGVAQGSTVPPAILVMRYQPALNVQPVVLVGKGVTFDSGGISIKPGKGMADMKGDMSGAAAVLSAFTSAVQLNLQKPITAIIPLTENMPDGAAQRPGDIVTAMNGKTIEIINTDAEGRLILADALVYATQYENPKVIVDIATLTGACSVALGDLAAGVLGTDQSTIDQLIQAGQRTGELLWQLPLFDGYLDYLKSDYADIANASEAGKAGTSTGAKFLQQFVGDVPWVHLDIASVMKGNGKGVQSKGMSGAGARLLLDWLLVDA